MANTKARRTAVTAVQHVADICLYGTHATGAGWLARTNDGVGLGTGEPRNGVTFTEAAWAACGGLEAAAGLLAGRVRVFAPGGLRMAWIELGKPIPTFGSMRWEEAPIYTLSVSELEAAASRECKGCGRQEEPRDAGFRPIALNADGLCAACVCAAEEARA